MVSNESRIRFSAAFEHALDELITIVAKERERDPEHYKKSPRTRLLAAVFRAIKDEIPADPQNARYYQSEAYGQAGGQWKRAKLPGQYRLFFKVVDETAESTEGKLIIFAWLSNEITLSKCKSQMDAGRIYRKSQQ